MVSNCPGLTDTFVSPVNFAWKIPRADFTVGYAFVAPTGSLTSGYWGNDLTSGATVYLTKDQGTSANAFLVWEGHGTKSGTSETPGQAITLEWGVGQVLPLKKDMSQLLQIGFVGWDQWQVSSNSGTVDTSQGPINAGLLPHYSAQALGFQVNYIVPKPSLSFFFNEFRLQLQLRHKVERPRSVPCTDIRPGGEKAWEPSGPQ